MEPSVPTYLNLEFDDYATTNDVIIREWWKKFPNANVAIATGHGLIVVDIDPRHGGSLEQLAKRFALPDTAMVRTGSTGWHLYFAYEGELKNSASKLGDGINTRGFNGYVVAPPSLHVTANVARTRPLSTSQVATLRSKNYN